jgi:hypothetical protein
LWDRCNLSHKNHAENLTNENTPKTMKLCKFRTVVALLLLVAALSRARSQSGARRRAAAPSKVDACYNNNIKSVPEHQVDKYVARGATLEFADCGDGTCDLCVDAVDDEVMTPLDAQNDSCTDPVVVSLQSGPSNGIVGPWVNGTGTITCYPNPGFFGTDSFEHRICDSSNFCDAANVTVAVGP